MTELIDESVSYSANITGDDYVIDINKSIYDCFPDLYVNKEESIFDP